MEEKVEKRFLQLLKSRLKPQATESIQSEEQTIEKASEKQSIPNQLRKLESEHQTKIDILSQRINVLKEEQEKLKNALDILKELNLNIPTEYSKKLNDYPEQMKNLEGEVEREKIFLDYLQNKIFPAIQEK